MLHELDIEATQRSLEHTSIRDDICGLTAGELANGKRDLLGRRHFASDKLLKCQMHVHTRRNGVDADLGARAMTALALQRDAETVHARERRTAVKHQAKRRLAIDMHGKGDLRARVLQQTVGDGGAGTLKGFLARLEQQLNRGVGINKLSLARFEHTSRTKQRRRVHIVTASMHAAVDRGKRLARLFRDGKGIHVTAQHDDRAGLIVRARTVALGRHGRTGTDEAHNTGAVDERGKRDVHLGQARLDIRRGLWEAITQLGHLVEIVSPRSELVCKSLSFCNKTVTDSGLRRGGGLGR